MTVRDVLRVGIWCSRIYTWRRYVYMNASAFVHVNRYLSEKFDVGVSARYHGC